jgi:hypothetical protein
VTTRITLAIGYGMFVVQTLPLDGTVEQGTKALRTSIRAPDGPSDRQCSARTRSP